MIKLMSKAALIFLILSFLLGGQAVAQQNGDSTHSQKTMKMKNHKMINQSGMMDPAHSKMTGQKDSIVREGVIDLKSIDKNEDGKVFQDIMDYNVISDKPGKCPLCGMTLKEVSLKKAKQTLLKGGYKVK